jgi:glycosyltransferase Alg8
MNATSHYPPTPRVDRTSYFLGSACGWLCLLALIMLLASMIKPHHFDPDHHKFIFALGMIGIWRYSNSAMHYLRGIFFLYFKFPRLRQHISSKNKRILPSELYMVVTSFRIPALTTYKVYLSLFEEIQRLPIACTVIASIVEKSDEVFIKEIMRSVVKDRADIELIIIRAAGSGKRDGLAHAFRALSRRMPEHDAVVGVLDGDTLIQPDCIQRAISVFPHLPNVGGITTNEFCRVEGGKLISAWHSVRFMQRHINMCSMALSKRVLTLTGRLSFFRASIVIQPEFILDIETDHLKHWRLGRFKFLTGDDKSSWFSLMRAGWDTFYVPDSHTVTIEHPPQGGFIQATRVLMFRWYGNSLRQNLRAVSQLGYRRLGLFTTYVLYDQRISIWTCLFGLTSSIAASLFFGIQYLLVYIFWILASRTLVTLILSLSRHPINPLFPFVIYYNQIVGSAMKIHTLFHMDKQSWTRQNIKLINNSNLDTKLNHYSSKIVMLSAFAIFLSLVSALLQLTKY